MLIKRRINEFEIKINLKKKWILVITVFKQLRSTLLYSAEHVHKFSKVHLFLVARRRFD